MCREDHKVRRSSRAGRRVEARDSKNSLHCKSREYCGFAKLTGFAGDVSAWSTKYRIPIVAAHHHQRAGKAATKAGVEIIKAAAHKSIQLQFLMDTPTEQDPRVYFAAERTFLAWIRTGLALMGVGFAVSRFGLFLRELGATESHLAAKSTGISLWSGVLLVGLGILVNIGSVVRYLQTVRELKAGMWIAGKVSINAVILALLLAAAGLGMGVYLMLVH